MSAAWDEFGKLFDTFFDEIKKTSSPEPAGWASEKAQLVERVEKLTKALNEERIRSTNASLREQSTAAKVSGLDATIRERDARIQQLLGDLATSESRRLKLYATGDYSKLMKLMREFNKLETYLLDRGAEPEDMLPDCDGNCDPNLNCDGTLCATCKAVLGGGVDFVETLNLLIGA